MVPNCSKKPFQQLAVGPLPRNCYCEQISCWFAKNHSTQSMKNTKACKSDDLQAFIRGCVPILSGYQDSNLGPPGPKPGALPDCATPRANNSGERGIRTPGTVTRTAV